MADPSEFHPHTREFLLKEFDALRRQMEQDIKQIADLLRYALLSSGVIWTWVLSHPQRFSYVVSFFPFLLVILLFWQAEEVRKYIKQIGCYIKHVETQFSLPEHLGWQKVCEKKVCEGNPAKAQIGKVERWIWWLLLFLNFQGAIIWTVCANCPK